MYVNQSKCDAHWFPYPHNCNLISAKIYTRIVLYSAQQFLKRKTSCGSEKQKYEWNRNKS